MHTGTYSVMLNHVFFGLWNVFVRLLPFWLFLSSPPPFIRPTDGYTPPSSPPLRTRNDRNVFSRLTSNQTQGSALDKWVNPCIDTHAHMLLLSFCSCVLILNSVSLWLNEAYLYFLFCHCLRSKLTLWIGWRSGLMRGKGFCLQCRWASPECAAPAVYLQMNPTVRQRDFSCGINVVPEGTDGANTRRIQVLTALKRQRTERRAEAKIWST